MLVCGCVPTPEELGSLVIHGESSVEIKPAHLIHRGKFSDGFTQNSSVFYHSTEKGASSAIFPYEWDIVALARFRVLEFTNVVFELT